ncbi:right-handed parallel beta-helix repeat-containing protein, partial [Candidatus Poribacteria bacterium]|nr:right-handed parallel beta-helix repeat-containing protein [Candidatus Poribacteria bacterium]
DPVGKLCLSCHSKGQVAEKKQVGENSHPTNFDIERVSGETDLPLFLGEGVRVFDSFTIVDGKKVIDKSKRKGKVMCATCHDVHQWDPADEKNGSRVNTEGDGRNSFLRKNNIKNSLCIECHKGETTIYDTEHDLNISGRSEKNIQGKTVLEDGTCSACHLMHNGTGHKIWAKNIPPEISKEDNIAKLCKSCHLKGQMAEKKAITKYSHPTGRSIKRVDGTTQYPLYDSVGNRQFNKKLLEALKTGKDIEKYYNTSGLVTCGTCHNVHQWNYKNKDDRPKSNIEGTGLNSFLRGTKDNTSNFCKDCHEDKFKIEKTEHDMAVVAKDDINSQGKSIRDDGICSACHLIHNGAGPLMWAREQIPEGDSVMTLICIGCHQRGKMGEKKQTGAHSHPCDRPITDWRVKPTLPLYIGGKKDPDGNVACSTCHNSHIWDPVSKDYGPGKNTDGTVLNSFLRIPNDKKASLCGDCHFENVLIVGTKHDMNLSSPTEKNVMGETVAESGSCGQCHLTHNALEVKLWSKVPGRADDPRDLLSALCKSCHAKGQVSEKKEIKGFNHPINITQLEAGLTTSLPLYDEMGKKKIDGKITCVTCHDPHRWVPGVDKGGPGKKTEGDGRDSFLRLENRRYSALCVDCHQRESLVVNTDHDLFVTVPDEENVNKETVFMSGACAGCHIMHNGNDIRRWGKPLGPGDDYITQLCHSCHFEGKCAESKIGVYTHPVGVKMQKGRTTTLPLYTKEGKKQKDSFITCVTCHYSHQWSPIQYQRNVLSKGLFSFDNIRDKVIGSVGYPSGQFIYIDTVDTFKPEIGQQYVIFKEGKIIARCVVDKVNPFSKTMEVFAKIIERDPEEKIEKGNYVVEKKKLAKGLEGTGKTSFLRKSNDSATTLCFDCHIEKETVVGTDHDLRITAPNEKNTSGETVYDAGLCSACHKSHMGASLYASSKQVNPDPRGLIYSPVCLGCHRSGGAADNKDIGVHHKIITFPTDEEINEYKAKNGGVMKESMKLQLPDKKYNLPLYNEDGFLDQGDAYKKKVVSCSTCHNEHIWNPTKPDERHSWDSTTNFYTKVAEGDGKNSFLRYRNDNYQLCNICHLATVHLEREEMLRRLGQDIKNVDKAQKTLEEKKKKEMELEAIRAKKIEEEERKSLAGKVGVITSIGKDIETDEYLATIKLYGEVALNNKAPGKYFISLYEDFEGATWKEYAKEIQIPILIKESITKLYVKFIDKLGNMSNVYEMPIPPIVISIKTDEKISKLPKLVIELGILRAKFMKIGIDKYLEKEKWQKFSSTFIYTFPEDSNMEECYVQFKDEFENKIAPVKVYTPEDMIKPRVRKYVYHEPIKITDDFILSIVFSETLNSNIFPKVKLTNIDGGASPVLPQSGEFASTNEENDTYIMKGIKLTKEMGGKILISVENAEGVIRNIMEPVSDKIFNFDTRAKIIEFYNSVNFKIKEGEKTSEPTITLLMGGKGAEQMMISENDPNFENCVWETFKPEKSFMLVPIAGEKTIYVKFRNDEKLVSDVFSQAIIFQKSSKDSDQLAGILDGNKTLTKENSPYYVIGEFTVARGYTLTIEPGAKLLFSDYVVKDKVVSKGILNVKGNIIAKGTKDNKIIFTSKKDIPEIGSWGMIKIDRNITDKKNVFEHCIITFADYGLWIEADNTLISNSTFENCKIDAIHLGRDCQGQIFDCNIKNNLGSGIFLKECSPEIYKNTIENNKEGISCVDAATPKISDNYINNNMVGIGCDNMSAPRIINQIIENNRVGIRIMDFSFPTIINSNIIENKEFGIFISESSPMIYRNIIQKNKIGIYAEKDYRDFKVTLNNISDNTEFNIKIWDWWKDFNATENYWGTDNKYDMKNKIYDKENYDIEPKEEVKIEEDVSFDFFSQEDITMEKMKEAAKTEESMVTKVKVFGIVRYTPYSFFKIKEAGVH